MLPSAVISWLPVQRPVHRRRSHLTLIRTLYDRQTVFMAQRVCPDSYRKGTRSWNNASCMRSVRQDGTPNPKMIHPRPSSSQSGHGTAGHTTPKVRASLVISIRTSVHAHTSPGIWLSPSPVAHPVLTLFGSTNLNSRSANLDTELSFVMVTSSQTLRRRLHEEVRGLWKWADPWKGADRTVRWRTRAIVGLVGGML